MIQPYENCTSSNPLYPNLHITILKPPSGGQNLTLLIYKQPVFTGKHISCFLDHLAEVGTDEASLFSSGLILLTNTPCRRRDGGYLTSMEMELKFLLEPRGLWNHPIALVRGKTWNSLHQQMGVQSPCLSGRDEGCYWWLSEGHKGKFQLYPGVNRVNRLIGLLLCFRVSQRGTCCLLASASSEAGIENMSVE